MEGSAKVRRLTDSQIESIESIPEHDSWVWPTAENRFPAAHYTDEGHYQTERRALIRKVPLPITVSAMLPDPKMAMAHDGFGVPVLLTRDKEGEVHAFLNVCTHRGTKLLEGNGVGAEDAVSCSRLTCRFHAWTFDIQGKLLGVAQSHTFPTLDKADYGLRRLQCVEAGGVIWVGLDPDEDYDFSDAQGQLAADLDAFGLGDHRVYKHKTFDLKANWKILMESFLESYHPPSLHKDTVATQFALTPTVLTRLGRNMRQATGRIDFTRDMIRLDPDEMHKNVTHAYCLFPTAVLVTSPHYINFMTMMPRGVDRTIVEYYYLAKRLPDSPEMEAKYDRSFDFTANRVFYNEDFRAAEMVQEGLASGALKDVTFGGLEEGLAFFHDAIADVLR